MRVNLTMIVRDEAANLPRCLESVRGLFDEIIVVDTGSTDGTRDIARDFGAQVFDSAWRDDFAASRNVALDHATGDYAFWLDADDLIEPNQRAGLRRLLRDLPPGEQGAFRLPLMIAQQGDRVVWGQYVRLFPIRPDVRWLGRVHENIEPALKRAGIPIWDVGAVVRHTGYQDEALALEKMERYSRLLAMPPRCPDEAIHIARRTEMVRDRFRALAAAQERRDGRSGSTRDGAIRAAERMGAPVTAALLRGLPEAMWRTP